MSRRAPFATGIVVKLLDRVSPPVIANADGHPDARRPNDELSLVADVEHARPVQIGAIGLGDRIRERDERLSRYQKWTIIPLLVIFGLGNLSTFTLFFLNGFGVTDLSDVSMASLSAATIAEVAAMLTIIVTRLFNEFGRDDS